MKKEKAPADDYLMSSVKKDFVEYIGKTTNEAIPKACVEFGVSVDELEI